MKKSEYKNIYINEEKHWYYVSTHKIVIDLIGKFAPNRRNLKILDAGCGTGQLIKKMEMLGDIYGIDISATAIKFSKSRGLKNVKKSSVIKLPYQKNSFDIIVSIDVLYHKWVKNDQKALNEFNRVLKPNGLLILKLPAFSWLSGGHDKIVFTKKRYTREDIKKAVLAANFKLLRNSYFFLSLFPIVLLSRFLFKGKGVNSDISQNSKVVDIFLTWIISIESYLLMKTNLPFGVSVITVARKTIV